MARKLGSLAEDLSASGYFDQDEVLYHDPELGHVIQTHQEIPEDFIADLKDYRFETSKQRTGNFHRVASVPAELVHAWAQKGYDINHMSAKQIVAKLKAEGFDYFVTTDKRV